MKFLKKIRLYGTFRRLCFFFINNVFIGTSKFSSFIKRKLCKWIGFSIGENTIIVGPLYCSGNLRIGKNCWIGKNFIVNGNGTVHIGDNCDLGPEVTFQTGGHLIGSAERRAGKGEVYSQSVGNGTWIGGRSTILNNISIGSGCVIAGCACVLKDVPDNCLIGGVPAKIIRRLSE